MKSFKNGALLGEVHWPVLALLIFLLLQRMRNSSKSHLDIVVVNGGSIN